MRARRCNRSKTHVIAAAGACKGDLRLDATLFVRCEAAGDRQQSPKPSCLSRLHCQQTVPFSICLMI